MNERRHIFILFLTQDLGKEASIVTLLILLEHHHQ